MKTAYVRARIEPNVKESAESILSNLGMSPSDVISLLYRQIIFNRGLPFEIRLPNEETLRTFEETDRGEDLTTCKDANELFERLGV